MPKVQPCNQGEQLNVVAVLLSCRHWNTKVNKRWVVTLVFFFGKHISFFRIFHFLHQSFYIFFVKVCFFLLLQCITFPSTCYISFVNVVICWYCSCYGEDWCPLSLFIAPIVITVVLTAPHTIPASNSSSAGNL